MGINGKLREAVVVDKELGRVAFEAGVRRRVDPALLEKGTGNTYKARIYPIPAKGYKRIVLAYEQELKLTDDAHYYNLPLAFQNELENFDLTITVFDQKTKPIIEKGAINELGFTPWQQNFKTTLHKENYIPNTTIQVQIPIEKAAVKQLRDEDYVYIYTTLNKEKRLRQQPKKITLLWDASLSMKSRNLTKEIALLDTYFQHLSSVDVELITYSNTVRSSTTYKVKNKEWDALKEALENTIYDGGTDYSMLASQHLKGDAVLLFTDGMHTLSTLDMYSKAPVFPINSLTKANHQALRKIASTTNGGYMNLVAIDAKEALRVLTEQPFRFLGYKTSNTTAEVYPNIPVTVTNDFSIAGKGLKAGDQITLQLGYGNRISKEVNILVDDAFAKSDIIKRLWAKEKLQALAQNAKKNKEAITQLGTAYQLVTDYTSLIVLDDVMDYVRYQITPPAELLEEYNRILSEKKSASTQQLAIRREVEADEFRESSERRSNRLNSEETESEIINVISPPTPEIIEVVEDEEAIEEILLESPSPSPNSAQYLGFMGNIPESDIVESSEVGLNDGAIPFHALDVPPTYPGCEDATDKKRCFQEEVRRFVMQNFNETVYANERVLPPGRSRIYAQFKIDTLGLVKDIRIRAGNQVLEEEATRVIKLIPRMQAGELSKKKVTMIYTFPMFINIPDNGQVQVQLSYPKYQGKLVIKDRKITTPYLKELREIKNVEKAYDYYLIQRTSYQKTPAYFIDVANYFKDTFNHPAYARRIVSNIPEIDGDDYELLKVFGYQMQVEEAHDIAAYIFERILELRPEDSQSYRDLALAYENIGKCQEALDLLLTIIDGTIYKNNKRRVFNGVKTISEKEIEHLIREYKDDLLLDSVPPYYKDIQPYDVRVVIDWNHNDTDIDLHIIDPNLEECYYSHNKTNIGGMMSQDMTQGFGPEEYTLKNAIKGDYFIKVRYYGDRNQKVETPTFMKVTMFKYYGTNKETKETQILRLTRADNEQLLAKLMF